MSKLPASLQTEFLRALTLAESPSAGVCAKAMRHWATVGLTGLALQDDRIVNDCVRELIAIADRRTLDPATESEWAAFLDGLSAFQASPLRAPSDPPRPSRS